MASIFGFGIIDIGRIRSSLVKARTEIIPSAISLSLVPFTKELIKGFMTRWR